MKLSDFDFLFKVDPMKCAGYSKDLKKFLMKTFPEKGSTIGKEVVAFRNSYDKYLLGEITDFKNEWAKEIGINPDIIPEEILQLDGSRIKLFKMRDKETIYYKSTVLTFVKAWHKLMKDFCNVDMELIDSEYSHIVLKNGQKLKVENLPFVKAVHSCVIFYYDPKQWQERMKMCPQATFLESLVGNFLAVAITNSNYDSIEFKKNNLLVCSFIVIEEQKIKENFYKAA
jgi:hypothetical protein